MAPGEGLVDTVQDLQILLLDQGVEIIVGQSGHAAIGYTVRGSKNVPTADNRIFTQVHWKSNGQWANEELENLWERIDKSSVGAVVIPKRIADNVAVYGLVLTYKEFFFAAILTPDLFAKGVLCVFDRDNGTNLSLYTHLNKLKPNRHGWLSDLWQGDAKHSNGQLFRFLTGSPYHIENLISL